VNRTGESRPRAFLSFDLANDEPQRMEFVSQLETSSAAFSATYWSSAGHSDRVEWDKYVRDKVGSCDLLIVLLGRQTASAANVAREIGMARQKNVPFFGVYVEGADGSVAGPAGLADNRKIPCDWKRIDAAVKQLMGEGKHHVFH
jgi:hypothetical protein